MLRELSERVLALNFWKSVVIEMESLVSNLRCKTSCRQK